MTTEELKEQFPLGSIVSYENEYYYVVGFNSDEDQVAIAYKDAKNSVVDQVSKFIELEYNEDDMLEATNRAGIPRNRMFKVVEVEDIELIQKPGDMIDGKEISGTASGSLNTLKYNSSSNSLEYESDSSFSDDTAIRTIALSDTDAVREAALTDNDAVTTNLKISRSLYYSLGKPRVLNLASTDADLKGFYGGFTDGRYGYFVPNNNGAYFGKVARVDLNDFATVSVLNLASTDAQLKGFIGGFTDGRYGYFVPYNNGAYFGKVARIQMSFGGNF